jgi:hypothetical protein
VTHGKIVNIRKKIILTAYNLLPAPLEVQIQEPRSKIVNIKNVYLLRYSLVFFSPKKKKKKRTKKIYYLSPTCVEYGPQLRALPEEGAFHRLAFGNAIGLRT